MTATPRVQSAEERAEAFRRLARVLLEQARQEIAERDATALAGTQPAVAETGGSRDQR